MRPALHRGGASLAGKMSAELKLSIGQCSDKGRKESNQDFHGVCLPREPQLSAKGVAVALADGISSSDAGRAAAEFAVGGFLEDYYCTSDAWSVKTSALRVLGATNSWLYSQTQQGQGRYDKDRGHVCTFSALVLKSTTAHVLHVGDGRVYLLHGQLAPRRDPALELGLEARHDLRHGLAVLRGGERPGEGLAEALVRARRFDVEREPEALQGGACEAKDGAHAVEVDLHHGS